MTVILQQESTVTEALLLEVQRDTKSPRSFDKLWNNVWIFIRYFIRRRWRDVATDERKVGNTEEEVITFAV